MGEIVMGVGAMEVRLADPQDSKYAKDPVAANANKNLPNMDYIPTYRGYPSFLTVKTNRKGTKKNPPSTAVSYHSVVIGRSYKARPANCPEPRCKLGCLTANGWNTNGEPDLKRIEAARTIFLNNTTLSRWAHLGGLETHERSRNRWRGLHR